MRALKFFEKQPGEIQDYTIGFARWLSAIDDTPSGHAASATNMTPGAVSPDDDITLELSAISNSDVVVRLSGGKHGNVYKVSASMDSANGLRKEADIMIRVIEV